MESERLTNEGSFVSNLAFDLCNFLGVRHCIPVCNATTGLQMAFKALDLKGEVITTPFTFPATIHALTWLGLKPVFVEPNVLTYNLDSEKIEDAITERTKAVLTVHLYGQISIDQKMIDLADKYDLKLVEDAAQSHGAV